MSDEPLIDGKEQGIFAAVVNRFRQSLVGSFRKDDAAAKFFAVNTARCKVKGRRIEFDCRSGRNEEGFNESRIICIRG